MPLENVKLMHAFLYVPGSMSFIIMTLDDHLCSLLNCRVSRHIHIQEESPGKGLQNPLHLFDFELLDAPVLDSCQSQGPSFSLWFVPDADRKEAEVRKGLRYCPGTLTPPAGTLFCSRNEELMLVLWLALLQRLERKKWCGALKNHSMHIMFW